MKHNLIKTDNYLLVVDNSEIKEGDWYKTPLGIYSQFNGTEKLPIGTRRVASHAPLNGAPYLDGLDVLPLLNQEDDIEKIFPVGNHSLMHMPNRHQLDNSLRQEGYNIAREKYKFTEEDLRKGIDMYKNSVGVDNDGESCYSHLSTEQIIQSLQQPKYPIAFECEMEPKFKHIGSTKEVKGSGSRIKNNYAGNPKTFINSEGRTEWVGKYIYE
jgi:hypothetical protein